MSSRWPLLLLIPFALAIGLLAGCTRQVTVESTWPENVPRNQSFSNVLVVGLSTNYSLRCRFERLMAASLRSKSVKATASCAEMTSKDPLTKDGLLPIVASTGADAVLVTELLGGSAKMVEGGSSENRSKAYYKPTGYGYAYNYSYYGSYGLPVTYVDFTAEQSAFALQRTVAIATNLFETRNASLVYAMETTARDCESRDEVLDVITLGVADRLRQDGLVR
jgi:hypothetical protein